jgi:hypothetical protein
MIKGRTLAENIAALAVDHPDVLDPTKWQGLFRILQRRDRDGLGIPPSMSPLRVLELIENTGIDD